MELGTEGGKGQGEEDSGGEGGEPHAGRAAAWHLVWSFARRST